MTLPKYSKAAMVFQWTSRMASGHDRAYHPNLFRTLILLYLCLEVSRIGYTDAQTFTSCKERTHFSARWWPFPPFVTIDETSNKSSSENPNGFTKRSPKEGGSIEVVGILTDLIKVMLKECCKEGAHINIFYEEPNMREVEMNFRDEDFVYPIVRSAYYQAYEDKIPGIDFLAVSQTEGPFVLTPSGHDNQAIKNSVFATWPLLVAVTSSAGLAGIIIWLLDRAWNPEQFPKSFIAGFWEGFWWAYITMTTVGYGDKTPLSIQARLFSFAWIIIGLVMMSIFTATLTTALTQGSTVTTNLNGLSVGVLDGSEEELVATIAGGVVSVYKTIDEVLEALSQRKVNAILIDTFYILTATDKLEDYKQVGIHPWPTVHGMITQNFPPEDMACFSRYLLQNRLKLIEALTHSLGQFSNDRGKISAEVSSDLMDDYKTMIVITLGLFAGLFVILLLWEFIYYRPRYIKKTNTVSVMQSKESGSEGVSHISTGHL